MYQYDQAYDRAYGEISLVPKDTHVGARAPGHEMLHGDRCSGRMRFDLVALQPVHIASGALEPPRGLGLEDDSSLVKAFFRNGEGTVAVPGSSLKGALRGLVELYTPACVCKTRARWPRDEYRDYQECRHRQRDRTVDICPVCRIFGAMGYQGHIRFDDAAMASGERRVEYVPPQYSPKGDLDHRRYYPYDQESTRTRTWPLEVAQVGARFQATSQFTNLTAAALGLVLIALGVGKWALCPRIGGGKSSGLGGVAVENLSVERWDPEVGYREFDGDPWEAVDVDVCIAEAEGIPGLLRLEILDRLADKLRMS